MSRPYRILTIVGASILGLVIVLVIASILVMQTAWFHNFVREKIIATVEDSSGGKVDIGSFDFDWTHLRATIRNFVLHGTEPKNMPPLFQASLLQVDLKLFSGLKQVIDLAALRVDRPQADIIVYPDGTTNVPAPKVKSKSDTSALQTIVDLKIGRFDLTNGSFIFNAQKAEFSGKGENVHAQLFYNPLPSSYKGQLAINPLMLTVGNNEPVDLNVSLPVTLEKDRVQLADARITTSQSQIVVNGGIANMKSPEISAHMNAKLAMADVRRLAPTAIPIQTGKGLPDSIDADVAVKMNDNSIQVSTARVTLGESNLEASGTLKDPSGNGDLKFNASLALGQMGRMLKVPAQPQGLLQASGTAKLVGTSGYYVNASINGHNLAFRQGQDVYRNINVTGDLKADPDRIELNKFKLAAFGGDVTGNAAVEKMRRFQFDGRLEHFDVRTLARTFARQDLPYDGVISGPVKAAGDLKAPGTKGIQADVHLAIAPGRRGVPVSGRLNADYNGAADLVRVSDSYIALPNTRLDLSGALDRQIQIKLVSRNLNDFKPVLKQPLPIELRGGSIAFNGAVTGKLADPHIAGHLQATNFALEDRPFDSLNADLSASPSGAQVQNASLSRGSTQLQFTAAVGLKQWKPEPYEPLQANASIQNADLADLLALAGQKDVPVSGTLNATAQIGGTIGDPRGNANLTAINGTAYDEHFDRITVNADFYDGIARISNATVTAGTARLDANAIFEHPKNDFQTGTLQLHLASNQMQLDQFNAVKKQNKGLGGTVQLNADVRAALQQVKGQEELKVTNVGGNASGRNLLLEGKRLGDFTATANTVGNNVNFNVTSDFAGSKIQASGQTRLEPDYPTTATASISNLPIEQVLAVADRRDINAKGNLSANAQLSGTLKDPHASGDLTLTKAVIYDEPLDRVAGRFTYSDQLIDVPNVEIQEGAARIDASARFDHPAGDLQQGHLQFKVASNQIQLGSLRIVQKQKPGLAGTLTINADGAGTLRKLPQGSTEPPILFSSLNANVGATGVQVDKKPLGDLTLKAETRGNDLTFNLASNLGQSNIQGQGTARLLGDYPVTAHVTFNNVTYAGLLPLIGNSSGVIKPPFDAVIDGQANISGPALKPDQLGGTVDFTKVLVSATPRGQINTNGKLVQFQNQGPIVLALKNQTITISSAHITGPQTDINVTGSVAMNSTTPLNLKVAAKTDLKAIGDFDHDVYSAGNADLNVTVRGTFNQPLVNGQLRLQNASFNMVDLPNGISNANGVIEFNGTNAVIRNLSAESGGGRVTANGYAGFGNGVLRYGLRANAGQVRVRTPEGASVVVSANINLTGNADHSVLGGNVTVTRISFNPRSDFGSILSSSSPPPTAPAQASGLTAGMKLDIRIRTAPDVAFQTALAQNIQADADLTLRGTLATPGMLGRVNVTSGNLVFFGTTYTVNSGSISFYNPNEIDPILDVDLETIVQGVDVILTVSGPVNNMKLTYRSDPPLQFDEIIALLAVGRTPTSDPTILANQPTPPPQSLQQMGESAIVSQAIASPLSERLKRVFGVSQLKIDPTFSGGSQIPTARVTLQQQVAKSVTFTYITDVSQANSEIVRVEWTINPTWSAIATRDQNGQFGVDFLYKKQFR